LRIDEIDEDSLEDADAQIRRAFANRRVASNGLMDARLARAMPLRVERELGRKKADIVLGDGTCSILPTTPEAIALVERLDGKKTLRRLSADKRAVKLCRELLGIGALKIVD
jgi:hypothetical protein